MFKKPTLFFKVYCPACYGTETWRLERIVRILSEIPEANVSPESDIEYVAEQFIAYSKRILCPGCGKTGTLTVNRILPGA